MRLPSLLGACLALLWACGDAPRTDVTPGADGENENTGGAGDAAEEDGATDGASGGDAAQGDVCETLTARVRPEPPEILVVLDRSGSMAGDPWDKAIVAIDQLIAAFPQYRFGLSMYPAVGEELDCNAGKLDVEPDADTDAAIHDVLFDPAADVEVDVGYTPTAKTLRAVEPYLTTQLDGYQERFVLLVTDGQPNCRADDSPFYTPDLEATLSVLGELAAAKVKTFVFGYRAQSLVDVMDQMAAAGGTGTHHAVEDESTILAAFEALGDSLAPCTFTLDEVPPGPAYVRVTLDGRELQLQADGFTFAGDRSIVLDGAACDAVRDGALHDVQVQVECEPVRVL